MVNVELNRPKYTVYSNNIDINANIKLIMRRVAGNPDMTTVAINFQRCADVCTHTINIIHIQNKVVPSIQPCKICVVVCHKHANFSNFKKSDSKKNKVET